MKARAQVPAAAQRDMVWIAPGAFRMGSDDHYPEERPTRRVRVEGFWIDRMPVTNAAFARFVEATGHVTVAEVAPRAEDYPGALPEHLQPGSLVFTPPGTLVSLEGPALWWALVPGADWRHPAGPDSTALDKYPVVHVALADALAYCEWAGTDLPTEAEWEFACRGGLDGAAYAWGDALEPEGRHMANVWQGAFPYHDRGEDGWRGTSPVGSYPPNGYGLHDMIGNVWEWTSDWWAEGPQVRKACCSAARTASICADDPAAIPRKVIKGGSHLCAPNYCQRYRPAARHPQPIDTSTGHVGFRCVVRS